MSDSWWPYRLHPASLSVHEILQGRILEWVAMSSSKGSSRPRDETHVSYISALAGGFSTTSATWEAPRYSEADNLDPLFFPTTHPIPYLAGRDPCCLDAMYKGSLTDSTSCLSPRSMPTLKPGFGPFSPTSPSSVLRPSLLKCCLGVVMKGGLTMSVGGFWVFSKYSTRLHWPSLLSSFFKQSR